MITKIVPYNKSKSYLEDIKEYEEWKSDFKDRDEIDNYYQWDFFIDADQFFFKDSKTNGYHSLVVVVDKNNWEIIHRYWQDELNSLEYAENEVDALLKNKKNIIKAVNTLLFWKKYDNLKETDVYLTGTFPFNFKNLEKIEVAGEKGNKTYKDFDIIIFYRWGQWYTYNYNAYNIIK